jgi:hypothetical protein
MEYDIEYQVGGICTSMYVCTYVYIYSINTASRGEVGALQVACTCHRCVCTRIESLYYKLNAASTKASKIDFELCLCVCTYLDRTM